MSLPDSKMEPSGGHTTALRVTRSSPQAREAILSSVRENSRPGRIYWLMNALATIIACYGLFANSPAVVIGSMVVAMLLGPIAGVALGLNQSDRLLLGTALISLSGGIAWILGISIVVGLVHLDVPLTGEILSRTKPNLFDLVIALASGGAGAIAVLSPRVGTAMVGVAVATALVPPLAAAGILFARGDFVLAFGALLLAATNIAAIQVAFSAVFWIGGYRDVASIGDQGVLAFLRRESLSIAIVCGLATVLGVQLHRAIRESLFESGVRAVLHQRFNDHSGFHLAQVRVDRVGHTTVVRAVVRGPEAPSAETVADAQTALPAPPDGSTLKLRVRFVEIAIVTSQGRAPDDGVDEP